MVRTKRFIRTAVLFFSIVSLASIANAETIVLAELLANNGEITSGDIAFDQFAYARTDAMPMADSVNLVSIMNGSGEHGLRIQGGFSESSDPGVGMAEFDFRVRPNAPSMGVDGATLASNTAAIFEADVTTTATLSNGSTLVAFDTIANGTDLLDFKDFGVVTELNVNIKVNIETFGMPSAGTVSLIDLTFRQAAVPEPSGPILIGFALPIIALRRLRLR